MWKQRGGESRCMGIQKSLHMHATQTYTARYGSRRNNARVASSGFAGKKRKNI